MSTFHEDVKRVISEFSKFLKVTLQTETLSPNGENEKKKILRILQKLFEDHDSLSLNSGDEGSVSSSKDIFSGSLDESRNTVDSSHGSEEDGYADNIPVTAMIALTNPIKMGYLERPGMFGLSWLKQYCVLHKNVFYIFKKPTDKKQNKAFFITDYEFRGAPQLIKDDKKKELCFELVCPGKKSYQFLCDNKEDMMAWRDVIQTASSNQPSKDQDAIDGDDIYEEFHDPPQKSVGKPSDDLYDDGFTDTPSFKHSPTPVAATAVTLGSAALKVGPPIPTSGPALPNKILKTDAQVSDEDDLVYEPIDPVISPGAFNKPVSSLPKMNLGHLPSVLSQPPVPLHSARVPLVHTSVSSHTEIESLPPPLPPHRGEEEPVPPPMPPHRGPALPLPPLPQESVPTPSPVTGRALPPPQDPVPTLPSVTGRALPPPPTNPLPPLPEPTKKMISPSLGKIMHPSEDYENLFYGKWDCSGSTNNELSFKRGQILHVISRDLDKDEWWIGALEEKIGLVPKNYLSPAYELIR